MELGPTIIPATSSHIHWAAESLRGAGGEMALGPQDPHPLPWGSLMVEWWHSCPPWPPGEAQRGQTGSCYSCLRKQAA